MLAIEIPGVTIEALIGKGAHAAVYRVRRDGRSYALKVPKQLRATDEATQQNFLREAAALALTRHESLPDIHEVGVLKGMPYLILEYVQGVNLQTLIDPMGLTEAEVIRLGMEVAGALVEFHDAGLMHRDIKPSNLMRATDATFKLWIMVSRQAYGMTAEKISQELLPIRLQSSQGSLTSPSIIGLTFTLSGLHFSTLRRGSSLIAPVM